MYANVIAIDGPAASGKSTIAELVAKKLDANHINTGAMYRAVAWKAVKNHILFSNTKAMDDLLAETTMSFRGENLEIDGFLPGNELRTPEISRKASEIATYPNVRKRLVELQRAMANANSPLVMEGRDIGTAVFPDAKWKIYLTASPEARAKRRILQDGGEPTPENIAATAKEIAERDRQDMTRKLSPLVQAPDAKLLDNSELTIEQSVSEVVKYARTRSMTYRVPYADTDQMGVVYYANYLVYFERFRNELLRENGITYKEIEKEGIAMPVVEAVCKYKGSARYDDLLTVTGRFAEVSGVKIKIECEVKRGDELLVHGYTVHVCVSTKTGRVTRPPEFVGKMV